MEKLSERLSNLNRLSKKILKYGLLVVLIAFIISIFLLKSANSIYMLNIAREFVSANVYALCEVVVGAIMFDMFMDKEDQKNDR